MPLEFQFIPADLTKNTHSAFVYDLLSACREEMLDDYCNNIVALLEHANQAIRAGSMAGCLVEHQDKLIGAIWIESDRNQILKIHGGLMPEYRRGFLAVRIFQAFIRSVFEKTNARKIEAWMPLNCRPAEKVLKWCGFQKEGLIREAYTVNGTPHPLILLGLTRNEYTQGGIMHGQRRRGKRRGRRSS